MAISLVNVTKSAICEIKADSENRTHVLSLGSSRQDIGKNLSVSQKYRFTSEETRR
jgi:hypothetical protein